MIYCPRCDKRITPDHRCLNRRHFFGMLAGAAATIMLPVSAISEAQKRRAIALAQLDCTMHGVELAYLRIGDQLSVAWSGGNTAKFYTLEVTDEKRQKAILFSQDGVFTVQKPCTITDVRVVSGPNYRLYPAALEITRSGTA